MAPTSKPRPITADAQPSFGRRLISILLFVETFPSCLETFPSVKRSPFTSSRQGWPHGGLLRELGAARAALPRVSWVPVVGWRIGIDTGGTFTDVVALDERSGR